MKIRLMGTRAECSAAVEVLLDSLRLGVLEVSDPYPNRGDSRRVRVYVEAHPTGAGRDDRLG